MDKWIEFAKNFEKEGVCLYTELGIKAKNYLTKKLFYTLARQEINHIEEIENFLLSKDYKKIEKIEEVENEIKEFFDGFKNSIEKSETQIDGYKIALEMEKKGYDQYEKFYKEAKDEKEKKFLNFLLQQEKSHIDAIINVYSYITNTSDWLEKEESKIWNWMNL